MGRKPYVGNLTYETTASDLEVLFGQFGTVTVLDFVVEGEEAKAQAALSCGRPRKAPANGAAPARPKRPRDRPQKRTEPSGVAQEAGSTEGPAGAPLGEKKPARRKPHTEKDRAERKRKGKAER